MSEENIVYLPDHLSHLTPNEFEQLFALIPAIKETQEFSSISTTKEIAPGVYTAPQVVNSEIVNAFTKLSYDMKLVYSFDWTRWDIGRQILDKNEPPIEELDMGFLSKLITLLVRSDRFCEGTLSHYFKSGAVLRILKRMKECVQM